MGPLLRMLPAAVQKRLSILIFHRVLPERDPLMPSEPTVHEFDWMMRMLRRHFTPISLEDAVAALDADCLPARAACVTFDDGYADNYLYAAPVLERYGIPATVFVSTDFLDGGRMWNDTVIECVRRWPGTTIDMEVLGLGIHDVSDLDKRRQAMHSLLQQVKYRDPAGRNEVVRLFESRVSGLPDNLMLNTAQLRGLARHQMGVGAHTCAHPILTRLPQDEAEREIADSRMYLEEVTQRDVRFFAYPNGKANTDYNQTHVALVERLGFDGALSTNKGVVTGESPRYELPRFTPWERQPQRFLLRLLGNLLSTAVVSAEPNSATAAEVNDR